jgi:hypothetical protein
MFYLPALHIDYTRFRMQAVHDFREDQARETALVRLRK